MSLPPVSAPIAVLVLAWDETTPAVRALVEAPATLGPAFDSVVVLVPSGPTKKELTPEEFLPLADSFLPAIETTEDTTDTVPVDSAAIAVSPDSPIASPPSRAELAPVEAPLMAVPVTSVVPPPLPVPAPLASPRPMVVAAAPSRPAVQVLRLSEFSLADLASYAHQVLPAPTWVGIIGTPTAPYVGSTIPVSTLPVATLGLADRVPSTTQADAPMPLAPDFGLTSSVAPPLATVASLPTSEFLPALDAEADEAPAFANLAPDFGTEPSPTKLGEATANQEPTDTLHVDATPAQAGWSEALASLQASALAAKAEIGVGDAPTVAPAAELTTTPEEAAADIPSHSALLPKTASFDVPNLNFQIIQYARFAVPLVLGSEQFAVLYAPAWPTWLAAQELRQRLHCPLVLHVSTLAADTEPLALATGWPAEIQRQALHRADLILTETPALAHRLRRELDLPAHRVCPVPAADAAAVAQALSTAQVWPAH